jgi:hypothetical protein
VQGKGAVNPAMIIFGRKFNNRCGNIHTSVPLFFFRVNMPADFQNVRVNAHLWRDIFQFFIRFQMIA